MRTARVGAALVAVLLGAACSGGGDPVVQGETTTTTTAARPRPTTTAGDGTTTTALDDVTTTTTTAACPPERPAAAVDGTPVSRLDLDGDGVEEVWAIVGNGASVLLYGLFAVDGCTLVPVTLDGVPVEFAVGGTVGTQVGVFCTDRGKVVAVTVASDDGLTYRGDRVELRLEGLTLAQEQAEQITIESTDPAFPDLAAFRC